MKTRQIIRNGMRQEAEFRGYRPSKFIQTMWEKLQIALLGGGTKGINRRLINQAKGTKPKKNYRTRVQAVIE